MKFINLNTGYSFDGLWNDNQQNGYVFWFPNEQSVGLIHSMPIAIVSNSNEDLTITIEDNDVFSLVTHSEQILDIDGYKFNEPVYNKTITITPEKINEKYIYVFNVSCSSNIAGEFICKITIGNYGYIKVGADLYNEYEPVYINLSNFGVEIPDTVQKAIYDSNVHEDLIDNILINRKFKELLSNYWDIIANRGSYKSLKNSLDWFEWKDNLKIKEIWKHYAVDKTIFDDRELLSVFENKLEDSFTNFVKTTYISLYCSMQDELDSYDSEYNPELVNSVFKWSRDDLQLKLALLAQFFGIYFLPIHLSILHATVEDEVFTNTIKSISTGEIKRTDCFGDFTFVKSNVKDNSVFKLSNVRAQVSNETVFAIRNTTDRWFGVDLFPKDTVITEDNIIEFSKQYYTGPGVIIPFKLTIPNRESEFIHRTQIYLNNELYEFNDIFNSRNNQISINFNLLLKTAKHYNIRFSFMFSTGKTISKSIDFDVECIENMNVNIYKIKSKNDSNGLTYIDFLDNNASKYLFKTQNRKDNSYYFIHLPYMTAANKLYSNYNGVKLTRTIVIDTKNEDMSEHKMTFIRSAMNDDFLEFVKHDYTDENNPKIKYLIYISKSFYADTPEKLYSNRYEYKYNVIRNDLGFYPQFHYLEKLEGKSINNYMISQYDALCCAIEYNDGKTISEFRYGKEIKESEWKFKNSTENEIIEYPVSSLQPFIADNNILKSGYYDIEFSYSLMNDDVNKCSLNSAFIVKHI